MRDECARRAAPCAGRAASAARARDGAFEELRRTIDDERERARVLAFAKPADQKRALVSRVLVRRCARSASERLRGRHADGAGQALRRRPAPTHANFNFSVSHDGDYVLVASGRPPGRGGRLRWKRARRRFQNRGTSIAPPSPLKSGPRSLRGVDLDAFLVLWACKEAPRQGPGQGLAYDLSRVGLAPSLRAGARPFRARTS